MMFPPPQNSRSRVCPVISSVAERGIEGFETSSRIKESKKFTPFRKGELLLI
jgi:hypothetical protein